MRIRPVLILLLLSFGSPLRGGTGIFREFIAPTPGSGPTSVADGHDGTLWFTEFHANKIGRIARDGTISEFAIPTPNSGPMGITSGVGGMWFTEFNANRIGRISPQGVITEFAVPTADSGPFDITGGSTDIWFSELRGNRIGRIRPDGVITEFPVPTPDSEPMGVGQGPDGQIWFTEFRGNKIGTVLANGTIREFSIPTPGSGPVDLSMNNLGRVWFTQFHARKIGRVQADGVVTEISLPPGSTGPWGIVADYYGTGAWFTARTGHRIGYIVPDGRVTEYPLPPGAAEPMGITQITEKLFLAAQAGNAIVSMQPDIVVVPGAGLIGTWDTDIRVSIPEFQSTTVFAGLRPLPPSVCAGSCGPFARLELPPLGSGRVVLGTLEFFSPFLANWYVRLLETGNLPAVHARMFNRTRPEQAGELPAIRLSTLTQLDPTVLMFPGASKTATKRSSLVLTAVTTSVSAVRFGPPGGAHVSIEALTSSGELLGGATFLLGSGSTLTLGDALLTLGVPSLDEGQIRVRKTSGGDLLWGYLATATTGGDLSITPGQVP